MKLSELSLGPVFLAHVLKSSLFLSLSLSLLISRTHALSRTHLLSLAPCTHSRSLLPPRVYIRFEKFLHLSDLSRFDFKGLH